MKRKIIPKIEKRLHRNIDCYPIHTMEFSIAPENFEYEAGIFVRKLLEVLGADFSKTVVLDQPFTGNNPSKSFKFFGEPKAIIVDRDPRDNYLFAKKFLLHKGRQIPTDCVENFVEYYRCMRDNQPYKIENKNILRVNFEDMIYRYDETTDSINKFCDLNLETHQHKYFVPEHSINNTQLFKRFVEYENEIRYIEEKLKEYLYPFELFGDISPSGKMFSGKSPLNK